ncbi:MAG: aminotransferase class V-fold PLP-dependent enzyme [Rhodospirillales bacterium]
MFDIAKLRAGTPGCRHVLHLNNAGAALPTARTLQVVQDHLVLEAEIGGYEAHDRNLAGMEHFYDAVARLLNCSAEEVAFIENATRAWDMAFYSLKFSADDRILTSVAEYASNFIAFLQIARKTGAVIEVVPDDVHGQIDVAALERMIDARAKLIAITHVPSQGGLVQPAGAVGKIAKAAGVPFLLDACQSAGQIPLDVNALGCDMLSGTRRKYLRGPRGTGFLYVRKALLDKLEPPFLDLHAAEWTGLRDFKMRADARRFENWECFYAGKLGLGVAIDQYLTLGQQAASQRIFALAAELRSGLAAVPGVTVQDRGIERCGIVTFTKNGITPLAMRDALRAQRINTSVSPGNYARRDLGPRGLESVLRASIHYYNSEDEIERFCAAVAKLG